MPDTSVPYLTAYRNISKTLDRIRQAQVPPRFSQDFLETTLDLSGGSARPVIPFLKRTGFLGADGTPTEISRRFRNPAERCGCRGGASDRVRRSLQGERVSSRCI
jgi:hypothetical protein